MLILYCPTCKALNDAGEHRVSLWVYYDEYSFQRLAELQALAPPTDPQQLHDYLVEKEALERAVATYCNHPGRLAVDRSAADDYATGHFGAFQTADDMRAFVQTYGSEFDG